MDIAKGKMLSEKSCTRLAWGAIGTGAGVGGLFLWFVLTGATPNDLVLFDYTKVGSIGSFLVGSVGVLWSLGAVLLYYSALIVQKKSYETHVEYLEQEKEKYEKKRHDECVHRAIDLLLDYFERKSGAERASNGYSVEWSLKTYESNKSIDTFLKNTRNFRSIISYLFELIGDSLSHEDRVANSRLVISLLTFKQRNCLALMAGHDEELEKILLKAGCKFPDDFSAAHIRETLHTGLIENPTA